MKRRTLFNWPIEERVIMQRVEILAAATTTQAGPGFEDTGLTPSFSADLTGTGAVSATVLIQVRNNSIGVWVTYGTLTMSGTASAGDAIGGLARYAQYRANLTAISGTGATVTVTMRR